MDEMQADTDAGLAAYMAEHASDKEWERFTRALLTQGRATR